MPPSTIILIPILLFSAVLRAEIGVVYSVQQRPYFTIGVPDSWQINVGSETDAVNVPAGENAPPRILTMMPADDDRLWFGAWVPVYLSDLDAAQEYLFSLDEFLVEAPILVESKDVDLNTMPARYFNGKGTIDGGPVDFFVMLFELSGEDAGVGVAIYIGPPDTTTAHFEELRGMMRSIAPASD